MHKVPQSIWTTRLRTMRRSLPGSPRMIPTRKTGQRTTAPDTEGLIQGKMIYDFLSERLCSKRRDDPGCQRGDRGKQRNPAQKRIKMLLWILIAFLFRQERKADALGAASPEQVDHRKIEQPQASTPFSASPKTENTTVKRSRLLSKMAAVDFSFGISFPS